MTCDGCFWLLRKDLLKNFCDLPDKRRELSPKELRNACKDYMKELSMPKWVRPSSF